MKKFIMLMVLATMLTPVRTRAVTLIDYGTMRITAYCPCESCSAQWGRKTYSGETATAGRTIAVDPDVIDIGSKVKIGDHVYVAEDIGGAVVGDTIDIFFDTHEEVEAWGVRYIESWVVKGDHYGK